MDQFNMCWDKYETVCYITGKVWSATSHGMNEQWTCNGSTHRIKQCTMSGDRNVQRNMPWENMEQCNFCWDKNEIYQHIM